MLCLWFTLIGINSDAAEAFASAGASVVSPVGVNNSIVNLWGAIFMSDASVGRLSIRIAGGGLRFEASDGGAGTTAYFVRISDTGLAQLTLADLIKLTGRKGTLSGNNIVDLTVSVASMSEPVTVTVAYN